MNSTASIAIATLVAILSGCHKTTPPPSSAHDALGRPDAPATSPFEPEIREAAYRQLLEDVPPRPRATSYLSFGETERGWIDPPDEFIARFANTGFRVAKPSQMQVKSTTPDHAAIIDPRTGVAGYVYWVKFGRWRGDDTVEVEIGRYGGPLDAFGERGLMSKRNGKWRFESSGSGWVS